MATISLHTLLATCVHMTKLANQTITTYHTNRINTGSNDLLNSKLKIEGDARSVATRADSEAQEVILRGIRERFPGVRIIAEEDEEADGCKDMVDHPPPPPICFPPDEEVIPGLESEVGRTVPFSDVTIYVDPLDGSREFVEGRVENCQCLIGVVLGSTPVAGVMNAPFFHLAYALPSSSPVIVNPKVAPFNGNKSIITTNLTNMRVGMSGDTGNEALMEIQSTLVELGCKTVDYIGGAGNKAMRLLSGEFDLVIFNFKTSLWDTCATSAVVTAAGGNVTDLYGEPIDHSPPADEEGLGNKRGVMMSRPGVPHSALADMFGNLGSMLEMKGAREPPYCSYSLTGNTTVSQPTYICLTCCPPVPGGNNLCFCPACVQKCHRGHDVMFVGNVESNCDCVENGGCKCEIESKAAADNFLRVTTAPPICCYVEADKKLGSASRLSSFSAFQIPALPPSLKACCRNLVEATKETHWLPAARALEGEGPSCPLENFAAQVFKFHLTRLQSNGTIGTSIDPATTGAEWWVQVKDISGINSATAIDIHYDKDEHLAEQFCLGSFPLFSTVTYLNAVKEANPTIVFDHTYEEPEDKGIEEIAISYPREGKQIIFDGRLLHGAPTNEVLKAAWGAAGEEGGDGEEEGERITFIVNIWVNSRPFIGELSDEVRERVGHIGECGTCEFVETGVSKVMEEEVLGGGERVRLHFVSEGATWDDEAGEEGGEEEGRMDDEEGEVDGLMLEMAPLKELPGATTRIKFKNEENCPRLVYVGGQEGDIENE
ncbi:hypothetical protein TrRE_jg2759 [Triparma retinervis]|uniref:3'(2'),5'-bisphosphate nucleotidase n=1 Tax=Triparma retinervis TaxID=2557542 RepID=A0A9W7CFA8_9STRA|nr:hypothetical protein TrRE_jg2759 [Triparma retinervis]